MEREKDQMVVVRVTAWVVKVKMQKGKTKGEETG